MNGRIAKSTFEPAYYTVGTVFDKGRFPGCRMSRTITVAHEESFGPGSQKRIYAGDRRIAVFNDGGALHAVDDACTHAGGSLSEGLCEDGVVTCAWHGAQFRLRDGKGVAPPAYRSLAVYPVAVTGGVVVVTVEDS